MHTPAISIVVPVYKAEAYLQECIDSILVQTFSDFELILVNDGSPDLSGEICDKNAAQDSRIRVIHQENQGASRARANGVSAAIGEYVCFVDADDTIPPHSLATLHEPTNCDIDIVLGKFAHAPCPPPGKISKREYQKMCAIMEAFHIGPCAKLFRRTLFSNEVFNISPMLKLGEDAIMNIRLAYRLSGEAYSTDAVVYQYRQHAGSTTHTLMRTPEQDVLLQTYRLASIPPADIERFLPCGLANNLILFWMTATCRVKKLPRTVLQHHRYLLSIRKFSNLKLGIYSGLLFYCTNSILRSTAIGLRNLWHRTHQN